MNKHLLLALIAIPMIAGCDSNGSSSTQAVSNSQTVDPVIDSTSTDIGPTSDSSDPNFSVVTNTAPEMEWETHKFTCEIEGESLGQTTVDNPDTYSTIATGLDPNPRVFSTSRWREEYEDTKYKFGPEHTLPHDGDGTVRLLATGTLQVKCGRIGDVHTVTLGY